MFSLMNLTSSSACGRVSGTGVAVMAVTQRGSLYVQVSVARPVVTSWLKKISRADGNGEEAEEDEDGGVSPGRESIKISQDALSSDFV